MKGVFYVILAETSRQIHGNTPLQLERGCVFCAAWSVSRKYKTIEL
jgi:hypothetical protein